MNDRIVVHIDELVLHGFAFADRHRVAEALQAELAARLARTGTPPALAEGGGATFDRVDAGAVTVAEVVRPAAVGRQVAEAITHALGAGAGRGRR